MDGVQQHRTHTAIEGSNVTITSAETTTDPKIP